MAKSKNLQLKGEGRGASKCFNVTAPNDVRLCSHRSESPSAFAVPLFELEQLRYLKDEDGGAVGPKSSFRLNSLEKDPPFPVCGLLDQTVVLGFSPLSSPNPFQGGNFSSEIMNCVRLGQEEPMLTNEYDGVLSYAVDLNNNTDANSIEDLNKVLKQQKRLRIVFA